MDRLSCEKKPSPVCGRRTATSDVLLLVVVDGRVAGELLTDAGRTTNPRRSKGCCSPCRPAQRWPCGLLAPSTRQRLGANLASCGVDERENGRLRGTALEAVRSSWGHDALSSKRARVFGSCGPAGHRSRFRRPRWCRAWSQRACSRCPSTDGCGGACARRCARVTPYLRSTSRALIPFLSRHMSKMTRIQVRTGILVACIIVPVSTENWRLQDRHFHTRRSLMVPAAVLRLTPLAGGIRYTSVPAQWAQRGVGPSAAFQVPVGVGLGDDLAAEGCDGGLGNRAHTPIEATGCDKRTGVRPGQTGFLCLRGCLGTTGLAGFRPSQGMGERTGPALFAAGGASSRQSARRRRHMAHRSSWGISSQAPNREPYSRS